MATQGGRENPVLIEQLLAHPQKFDFFQAVRLLERAACAQAKPDQPPKPLGGASDPRHEAVRFVGHTSLDFPAAAIAGFDPEHRRMSVAFFGFLGAQGVLPRHYTKDLLERLREHDPDQDATALRDFLDIFQHRLVTYFYRAWRKNRFPIDYESSNLWGDQAESPFTQALHALVGLGTRGLRRRQAFDDEAILYFSGHFARAPRSAAALQAMLADFFALPLRVEQFRGQWLMIDPAERSRLSARGPSRGRNCRLGADLVVGSRLWDVQGSYRIRVGPLTYEQFQTFMPRGHALKQLFHFATFYAGGELDCDVQVVLIGQEVPSCRLGDKARPARLGWNTWLQARAFPPEVQDAVFKRPHPA